MLGQTNGQKKKRVVDSAESKDSASNTPASMAQQNVELITELERKAIHSRSTAERLADKIIRGAGSAPFVILHLFWFGGWILVNTGFVPGLARFDPFPFSFLTLIVSLEAIFLTLLVLMSQNRMIKEADKRAHLDLQLNMLAEQEGTELLRLVQRICRHLGLEDEIDENALHLEEQTDVNALARTLDEHLPG